MEIKELENCTIGYSIGWNPEKKKILTIVTCMDFDGNETPLPNDLSEWYNHFDHVDFSIHKQTYKEEAENNGNT